MKRKLTLIVILAMLVGNLVSLEPSAVIAQDLEGAFGALGKKKTTSESPARENGPSASLEKIFENSSVPLNQVTEEQAIRAVKDMANTRFDDSFRVGSVDAQSMTLGLLLDNSKELKDYFERVIKRLYSEKDPKHFEVVIDANPLPAISIEMKDFNEPRRRKEEQKYHRDLEIYNEIVAKTQEEQKLKGKKTTILNVAAPVMPKIEPYFGAQIRVSVGSIAEAESDDDIPAAIAKELSRFNRQAYGVQEDQRFTRNKEFLQILNNLVEEEAKETNPNTSERDFAGNIITLRDEIWAELSAIERLMAAGYTPWALHRYEDKTLRWYDEVFSKKGIYALSRGLLKIKETRYGAASRPIRAKIQSKYIYYLQDTERGRNARLGFTEFPQKLKPLRFVLRAYTWPYKKGLWIQAAPFAGSGLAAVGVMSSSHLKLWCLSALAYTGQTFDRVATSLSSVVASGQTRLSELLVKGGSITDAVRETAFRTADSVTPHAGDHISKFLHDYSAYLESATVVLGGYLTYRLGKVVYGAIQNHLETSQNRARAENELVTRYGSSISAEESVTPKNQEQAQDEVVTVEVRSSAIEDKELIEVENSTNRLGKTEAGKFKIVFLGRSKGFPTLESFLGSVKEYVRNVVRNGKEKWKESRENRLREGAEEKRREMELAQKLQEVKTAQELAEIEKRKKIDEARLLAEEKQRQIEEAIAAGVQVRKDHLSNKSDNVEDLLKYGSSLFEMLNLPKEPSPEQLAQLNSFGFSEPGEAVLDSLKEVLLECLRRIQSYDPATMLEAFKKIAAKFDSIASRSREIEQALLPIYTTLKNQSDGRVFLEQRSLKLVSIADVAFYDANIKEAMLTGLKNREEFLNGSAPSWEIANGMRSASNDVSGRPAFKKIEVAEKIGLTATQSRDQRFDLVYKLFSRWVDSIQNPSEQEVILVLKSLSRVYIEKNYAPSRFSWLRNISFFRAENQQGFIESTAQLYKISIATLGEEKTREVIRSANSADKRPQSANFFEMLEDNFKASREEVRKRDAAAAEAQRERTEKFEIANRYLTSLLESKNWNPRVYIDLAEQLQLQIERENKDGLYQLGIEGGELKAAREILTALYTKTVKSLNSSLRSGQLATNELSLLQRLEALKPDFYNSTLKEALVGFSQVISQSEDIKRSAQEIAQTLCSYADAFYYNVNLKKNRELGEQNFLRLKSSRQVDLHELIEALRLLQALHKKSVHTLEEKIKCLRTFGIEVSDLSDNKRNQLGYQLIAAIAQLQLEINSPPPPNLTETKFIFDTMSAIYFSTTEQKKNASMWSRFWIFDMESEKTFVRTALELSRWIHKNLDLADLEFLRENDSRTGFYALLLRVFTDNASKLGAGQGRERIEGLKKNRDLSSADVFAEINQLEETLNNSGKVKLGDLQRTEVLAYRWGIRPDDVAGLEDLRNELILLWLDRARGHPVDRAEVDAIIRLCNLRKNTAEINVSLYEVFIENTSSENRAFYFADERYQHVLSRGAEVHNESNLKSDLAAGKRNLHFENRSLEELKNLCEEFASDRALLASATEERGLVYSVQRDLREKWGITWNMGKRGEIVNALKWKETLSSEMYDTWITIIKAWANRLLEKPNVRSETLQFLSFLSLNKAALWPEKSYFDLDEVSAPNRDPVEFNVVIYKVMKKHLNEADFLKMRLSKNAGLNAPFSDKLIWDFPLKIFSYEGKWRKTKEKFLEDLLNEGKLKLSEFLGKRYLSPEEIISVLAGLERAHRPHFEESSWNYELLVSQFGLTERKDAADVAMKILIRISESGALRLFTAEQLKSLLDLLGSLLRDIPFKSRESYFALARVFESINSLNAVPIDELKQHVFYRDLRWASEYVANHTGSNVKYVLSMIYDAPDYRLLSTVDELWAINVERIVRFVGSPNSTGEPSKYYERVFEKVLGTKIPIVRVFEYRRLENLIGQLQPLERIRFFQNVGLTGDPLKPGFRRKLLPESFQEQIDIWISRSSSLEDFVNYAHADLGKYKLSPNLLKDYLRSFAVEHLDLLKTNRDFELFFSQDLFWSETLSDQRPSVLEVPLVELMKAQQKTAATKGGSLWKYDPIWAESIHRRVVDRLKELKLYPSKDFDALFRVWSLMTKRGVSTVTDDILGELLKVATPEQSQMLEKEAIDSALVFDQGLRDEFAVRQIQHSPQYKHLMTLPHSSVERERAISDVVNLAQTKMTDMGIRYISFLEDLSEDIRSTRKEAELIQEAKTKKIVSHLQNYIDSSKRSEDKSNRDSRLQMLTSILPHMKKWSENQQYEFLLYIRGSIEATPFILSQFPTLGPERIRKIFQGLPLESAQFVVGIYLSETLLAGKTVTEGKGKDLMEFLAKSGSTAEQSKYIRLFLEGLMYGIEKTKNTDFQKTVLSALLAMRSDQTSQGETLRRILEHFPGVGPKVSQFLAAIGRFQEEITRELMKAQDRSLPPDRFERYLDLESIVGPEAVDTILLGRLLGGGSMKYAMAASDVQAASELVLQVFREDVQNSSDLQTRVLKYSIDYIIENGGAELAFLKVMVDGAMNAVKREKKYQREAQKNAIARRRLYANLSDERFIFEVPNQILLNDKLLKSEFARGKRFSDLSPEDQDIVAQKILEVEGRILFADGDRAIWFDPDRHAGNYLIEVSMINGKKVYRIYPIDFGQLTTISRPQLGRLIELFSISAIMAKAGNNKWLTQKVAAVFGIQGKNLDILEKNLDLMFPLRASRFSEERSPVIDYFTLLAALNKTFDEAKGTIDHPDIIRAEFQNEGEKVAQYMVANPYVDFLRSIIQLNQYEMGRILSESALNPRKMLESKIRARSLNLLREMKLSNSQKVGIAALNAFNKTKYKFGALEDYKPIDLESLTEDDLKAFSMVKKTATNPRENSCEKSLDDAA